MNDLPCLCAGEYRCNRCRARDWHAQWDPTRRRMRDNKLAALAKDFDIDDDQWCVLLYTSEQDDLDLLLFQGETS